MRFTGEKYNQAGNRNIMDDYVCVDCGPWMAGGIGWVGRPEVFGVWGAGGVDQGVFGQAGVAESVGKFAPQLPKFLTFDAAKRAFNEERLRPGSQSL
jgi:hypothetical protein